jgi:hypothetical protein
VTTGAGRWVFGPREQCDALRDGGTVTAVQGVPLDEVADALGAGFRALEAGEPLRLTGDGMAVDVTCDAPVEIPMRLRLSAASPDP